VFVGAGVGSHCACVRAEFDEVVRESRDKAETAVQLIPEIEQNILDAETSTNSALTALSEADNYASAAEQLARAARDKSNSSLTVRRRHIAYRPLARVQIMKCKCNKTTVVLQLCEPLQQNTSPLHVCNATFWYAL